MTLSSPEGGATRTVLRIHHEHLADAAERERMREHWQRALDRLSALVEESSDA